MEWNSFALIFGPLCGGFSFGGRWRLYGGASYAAFNTLALR